MLSLSTLQVHLGPMLSSSLCSEWLLSSTVPIYVFVLLLSISRFTVEKEVQVMLILKRLPKIIRNLSVTEPLEGVRILPPAQKQPHIRPRQNEQIILVPSCCGVPSQNQLTDRDSTVKSLHQEMLSLFTGDAEFVRSAQGITGPSDQCEE